MAAKKRIMRITIKNFGSKDEAVVFGEVHLLMVYLQHHGWIQTFKKSSVSKGYDVRLEKEAEK